MTLRELRSALLRIDELIEEKSIEATDPNGHWDSYKQFELDRLLNTDLKVVEHDED